MKKNQNESLLYWDGKSLMNVHVTYLKHVNSRVKSFVKHTKSPNTALSALKAKGGLNRLMHGHPASNLKEFNPLTTCSLKSKKVDLTKVAKLELFALFL